MILVFLLSVLILHEQIGTARIIGAGIILMGIMVVARS
jgi:uncharacterized membrane protein